MSTEAGGCCGQSQSGCLVYQNNFLLRLLQCLDVIPQLLLTWMLDPKKKQKNNNTERYGGSVWGGTEFSDNKDVSEESVITVRELPEFQTHLQSQTITPLSYKGAQRPYIMGGCSAVYVHVRKERKRKWKQVVRTDWIPHVTVLKVRFKNSIRKTQQCIWFQGQPVKKNSMQDILLC